MEIESFATPRRAAAPPRARNRLALAKRGAVLLLFGGLTLFALLRFGGDDTLTVMRGADWRLVILAAAIHYSGFAVRGHRWQRILAGQGHRLPYRRVAGLLIGGWFVSALLPARAGDAARVAALRLARGHAPVPVADGVGSIVLERALDILAILGLGAGLGFFALQSRLPAWVLAAYGAAAGLLAIFAVSLLLAPRLIDPLRRLSARSGWQTVLDFGQRLASGLGDLVRQPGNGLLLLLESGYIWFCDALLLWLVLAGVGQPTPLVAAGFIALTVDVFAAAPLTPGGIGQIEAVYAALLALFALPVTVAPAAVLLVRGISYWSFLLFSGAVAGMTGINVLDPGRKLDPGS